MLTGCLEVTRRPAGPGDDGYRQALFADSRDDLLLLPAAVREPLLAMQFRAQRQHFALAHPQARHDVLVAGGVDVGALIVDESDDGVDGHVQVVDIVVDRTHRRRGIAEAALRAVIESAQPRPVRLHVWPANVVARALYERLGFVVADSASDPSEGHIAMERRWTS